MDTRTLDAADDAQMQRFHEITYRAEREDGRPWNPMWAFEEMAGLFREPNREQRTVGIAAWDGDRMVGAGFLMLSLLDNLGTAYGFVAVEPELRGRGLGDVTLAALVDLARAEGRTQLLANAGIPFEQRDDSPVIAWAQRNGFEIANVEIQRNLELPVDPALLDEIATESAAHHADYEVRTFIGGIPDELLPSWCELENTFMLEAPMGDVDVEAGALTPEAARDKDALNEKVGRRVYRAVAVRRGEVVAGSDLAVNRAGDEAHQWGTLVHRDHRGHRLGAAVKVANLRALAATQPAVPQIVTTNAEVNPWMVAINDRLGFVPVAVVPTFKRSL